ncbi:MAG: fibronectin type III-like domain-contianing protein, partial [Candidatus Eremiobacteraeota bacterium]|nr:fibronectin type III-like domain-contianing protein [Candidatus Eremiobacteraeota bacterium]
GPAIARLLFGEVSPSGRLPITFPASVAQLPRADLPEKQIDYNVEGADVGYKWFDAHRLQPLFAFGFGLTYSRFQYSNLSVEQTEPELVVRFDVRNVGERDAMEVAQLYIQLPPASGADAPRLAGWKKLAIPPGQTRTVRLTIDKRLAATFDSGANDWRISAGTYRVSAGPNERDQVLSVTTPLRARRFAP